MFEICSERLLFVVTSLLHPEPIANTPSTALTEHVLGELSTRPHLNACTMMHFFYSILDRVCPYRGDLRFYD